MAEHAFKWTRVGCSEPADLIAVRAVQVSSVRLLPGYAEARNGTKVRRYEATVRRVGYFGIEVGEAFVTPDEVICSRVSE